MTRRDDEEIGRFIFGLLLAFERTFKLFSTLDRDTLLFVQGAVFATCVYLAFEWATFCDVETSFTTCLDSQVAQLTSDSGCGLFYIGSCYRCCNLSSGTKQGLAYAAASICMFAVFTTASDPEPGPKLHACRRAAGLPWRMILHACDIVVEGAKWLVLILMLKLMLWLWLWLILGPPRSPRICYTGPRGGRYTITSTGRKNYNGC